MSWLFSRALVEASLGDISSDGALYAPLSATPTPQVFSLPAKTMGASPRFRFGTTCERLTDDRGEAVLTWCLAASPVRTSPLQAKAQASRASAPVCGPKWRGSSARWDHDSSSWKTVPSSPDGVSMLFSGTWPRWGLMRDGVCSELLTPARPTSASGSGSPERWLTPTANDGKQVETAMMVLYEQGTNVPDTYKRLRSQVAARERWPSPRKCSAMAATISPKSSWAPNRFPNLETVLGRRTWLTPIVSDANGGRGRASSCQGGENLRTAIGGLMNPTWVEWLMGWPLGWTDLRASAMDKFQQWRRSHGVV